MKRRRTKPRVPEDLPIGDEHELDYKDWYNLLSTSSVRARLMEYVLHSLARNRQFYRRRRRLLRHCVRKRAVAQQVLVRRACL